MKAFIFCLLFSITSFASDGKIIFLKGKLQINGKTVSQGAPIKFGDRITTGAKALAIVKLKPNTSLKLKSQTKIIIEKPKENNGIKSYSYLLEVGEMFVEAIKTKKTNYKVKSNNAVFGVRGTQFFVSASGNNQNWMCVNEGIVSVEVKGQKEVLEVKKGQGVNVLGFKLPKIKNYEWTKNLNWKMQGEFEDVKDTVDIENLNYDIKDMDYE